MKKYFLILLISLSATSFWAQEETPQDTLNTEVINVVKPYSPSISDAFKIKDKPNTSTTSVPKKVIKYQISSVPVASTFTPSKGTAQKVKNKKKERLYDNYISLGFGNYTTPLIEGYIRLNPTRDSEMGVMLKHHSSQGGIKEVLLDNSFYDSNVDVYYKSSSRDMDWKVNLGAMHQLYNWYGVLKPQEDETEIYSKDFLADFDTKQRYLNIGLDGEIDYFNSYFKGAKANVRHFSDAYNSSEFRFRVQPKVELPLASEIISFDFDIDYLSGAYKDIYTSESSFSYPKVYNYFNIGVTPSFKVLREYFSFNLGVKAYFAMDMEQKENAFKIYPNVAISYQLLQDVLTVFAGATGGLNHNTYLDATLGNPFVSPNHYSTPTDQVYKAFGGVKGKLASNISYVFKAYYADEKAKSFYTYNRPRTDGVMTEGITAYALGNSFSTVYDDVKTLGFSGELAVDLSKTITIGAHADYVTYDLKTLDEAWNLPNVKATIFSNYHQGKWTGDAKLFVVGAKKDYVMPFTLVPGEIDFIKTNTTYFDVNAGISYAFSNRLSAFGKGHNLLGTQYNRYYNYPVQGIQVMAGITYKFDVL